MNNEVVEEFLQEAIIMKKFNHTNVMSLFGVSVHNDKSCVILPLMINGDLKSYLTRNDVSMTYIIVIFNCVPFNLIFKVKLNNLVLDGYISTVN